MAPTAAEEAAFMADLFSGMDTDAFFSAVPSPDPSPVKSRRTRPPLKPRIPATPPRTAPQVYSVEATDVDMAALVEGAEDWDWDADLLSPKKGKESKTSPSSSTTINPESYIPETCTRCVVEHVLETTDSGRFKKNLAVRVDQSSERRTVLLLDDWAETDVRPGDTVNVLGSFDSSTISITASSNLLILHPDLLLTATSLSNASQCARRPLLSLLIRSSSSSDASPSLVWGNMLHEVMQACLRAQRWDARWVDQRIEEVVQRGVGELVKIGVGIEQAVRDVKARAGGLGEFGRRYVGDTPKSFAILTDTRAANNAKPSLLAIAQLHDVEEDIWSPTYGLKGKLDATVHAHISDPAPPTPLSLSKTSTPSTTTTTTTTTGPAPFEIKTGLATSAIEHRAQTLLYTLLAGERYGAKVESGLLYYTHSAEVVRVPRRRNEVRELIAVRNRLAGFAVRRNGAGKGDRKEGATAKEEEPFLPPTIDDERVCKRCFAVDACMLYRKAIENVEDTTSPIADLYELKTGHLTPSQTAFFKQWEALLSMEEGDLVRFKKELWTLGAREREDKGRCFADMRLDESFGPDDNHKNGDENGNSSGATNKIHQYTYRFTRASPGPGQSSLLNGHMSTGDAISVSIEPKLLALARGFIVELTPQAVAVGVDHELSLPRLRELARTSDLVFRIDKDELFGGMGRVRDNLARLFYADGDARRLGLVVDLVRPRFEEKEGVKEYVDQSALTKRLNENQRAAMTRVLDAQDYALILGMPGTGKTTVIAALIRVLVGLGKSVLLTSYTHSAVDTILLKLADGEKEGEVGFGILRLGNVDKVHPDVQKYTLATRRTATTVEQLEHQIMTPPVVATTCLSIDHALFSRRTFDYCIVDEASQITLPTCLGPLRFADKFVLVGDHFQLPPLVRNPAARKGGLDVSLFRRLSDAHPHAVIDLTHQYRMNEDIMLLSNKLIYGDRLRCGSEEVAKRGLVIPDGRFLSNLHAGGKPCHEAGCWIEKLLSESCKAVFVDTDALPALDSRIGDLVQNPTEAALVHQLTEGLLNCGVQASHIGIISLYRQQIKLLSHLLEPHKDVEILTADRSQGRDKDCVIISMVRSNDAGQVGDLVKDWRRMNVSFTRARSKLIVFGSRKTLQATPLLSEFFDLMDERGWVIRLSPGADKVHEKVISWKPINSTKEPALSPGKRGLADVEDGIPCKENIEAGKGIVRPAKVRKVRMDEGLLRGRPILQDLVKGGT